MKQGVEQDGTYTISTAASLFGASRRVLPDAVVPPVPVPPGSVVPSYGWITGACPSPNKTDKYVVEFVGKRTFRIIAYVDRFGRAFATDHPLTSPPACRPDMNFARFPEQEERGRERGCVEVRSADGTERQVAQYTCVRDRYSFTDTWFDFGPHGTDLSYDDALARAYLAFVHRPAVGGADVPARGIAFVHEHLEGVKLLPGLRAVVRDVKRAESDPVVNAPALARSLVRWLEEAGWEQLQASDVADDALRLVRTVRYADSYYIALEDEKAPVARRTLWGLEAALNRFLLVESAFGERASLADDADCGRWDAYLIETGGSQPPSLDRPAGAPAGLDGGEWEVRCRVAAALERLRMPIRVEASMRVDAGEGVAAFDLVVPDASLMPARRWADAPAGSGWVDATEAERDAQARRYAMHIALAVAAAAFEVTPAMERVDVAAVPLAQEAPSSASASSAAGASDVAADAGAGNRGGEFPSEREAAAYFQVTFTRRAYEESGRFRAALEGDPTGLFAHCGATFDLLAADPFAVLDALPSTSRRKEAPEAEDAPLPEAARPVLGADDAGDLRIVHDARRRRIAEGLADRVARASSATEAIRAVREVQEAAEQRGDDLSAAACTRLMAALAEGSLDTEDQNATVVCFLGEDRCLAALGRARALAQTKPEEAVAVLMDAVAETAALDGYVDGAATVYRSFDSYASRILYQRAVRSALREQRGDAAPENVRADEPACGSVDPAVPSLARRAAADAGKRVLLAPDSFFLCHLEIASLLERSFERVDEALRYGQRAVELSPASATGYRQLGRIYMLVGDMENAIAALDAGLRVATQPADVAVAYYQLAYALWKAGRPRAGAACYFKSIMTAPVVAMQAMTELKGLVDEQGLDPLERSEVDDELRREGVVVSPTEDVFEALDAGAAAAVDAGLFPVARNLLSLRLHYRPDDALVGVLSSL